MYKIYYNILYIYNKNKYERTICQNHFCTVYRSVEFLDYFYKTGLLIFILSSWNKKKSE